MKEAIKWLLLPVTITLLAVVYLFYWLAVTAAIILCAPYGAYRIIKVSTEIDE